MTRHSSSSALTIHFTFHRLRQGWGKWKERTEEKMRWKEFGNHSRTFSRQYIHDCVWDSMRYTKEKKRKSVESFFAHCHAPPNTLAHTCDTTHTNTRAPTRTHSPMIAFISLYLHITQQTHIVESSTRTIFIFNEFFWQLQCLLPLQSLRSHFSCVSFSASAFCYCVNLISFFLSSSFVYDNSNPSTEW